MSVQWDHSLSSLSHICSCTVPCRSDQSGSICIDCSIPTCIHTWSAAGNSLQWVGAQSNQSATDLLSWSSPSWQESAFLVDILLTDSRCSPPGRQHVSHAASVLIGLGDDFVRPLLSSKHVQPCLIDTFSCARSVIHYDHKPLQGLQVFIIHYRWVLAEFAEDSGSLITNIPGLQSRLLPFATEC